MCWCCFRLACSLLHSFQSLSWGWVWMGLLIQMLFSIFFCTAEKLKLCRNLWVHFVSRLLWIWSSRFQFCCGWSLHCVFFTWLIAVASGKWICAGLVLWDASLGVICCHSFNAEYRLAFLRLWFLQIARHASWQDSGCSHCSVESIRVVWSVSPAWEAVELTLGDRPHLPVRGPRPYWFGSDNRGCSKTMPGGFLPSPNNCLPF